MANIEKIQKLFWKHKCYYGRIDGIVGELTQRAFLEVYNKYPIYKIKNIIEAAQVLLVVSGFGIKIDGVYGKKTERAIDLALSGRIEESIIVDLPSNRWGSQSDIEKNFGEAGSPNATGGVVLCPYPLRLAWDLDTKIDSFRSHFKVASSITSVLKKVQEHYTQEEISSHGFDIFGGCFNKRLKTNGRSYSTHAYGVAVDFDPLRNKFAFDNKKAYLSKPVCQKFLDLWEEEGWTSLGRKHNYDWMHIQAPSV